MKPLFLLAILFTLSRLAAGQLRAVESTNPQVESGRKALESRGGYPWYDSPSDDLKRVEVQQPWSYSGGSPSSRGGGFGNFSWLEMFAWTAFVLLLVLLTYFLIRAFLKRERNAVPTSFNKVKQVQANDAARIQALPFRVQRGANDLLGEAKRLYEAGNFSEAIIYLFSYELVELDRNQQIRLTRGKTNRQYLRELARRPILSAIVGQTMIAFEDVFFGNHPLDRPRFEACWSRVGEFESTARQGAS
jgi:hypothetical protein